MTRVACLFMHNNGKGAAQSTFLMELHNLGHVPSEMKKMKKPVSENRSHNLIGGTGEPGNWGFKKLFFKVDFWWKNPRKCSLRSLCSRVLSQQQNGELKKLLEIPVPGSLVP